MKTIEVTTPEQVLVQSSSNKNMNKKSKNSSSPKQNFVLSKREAEAASPESLAVCGEEDPGEGLEFLVTDDITKKI